MVQVLRVPGSLQRVCQLTGEHDRTTGRPVPSRTLSTAGLVGTDLGSSVDLGDRLVFLFGDTWPDPGLGDTVAWTTATEPEADLRLTFATDPSGRFRTFVLQDRFVPSGRGGTGVFEVPTGGFRMAGATVRRLQPGPLQGRADDAQQRDVPGRRSERSDPAHRAV